MIQRKTISRSRLLTEVGTCARDMMLTTTQIIAINSQHNFLIGRQHLRKLFLAVAYGVVLSQIPSEQFKDFGNYLVYAEYSWQRLLHLWSSGLLNTLANEPVWLLVNTALARFLDPESVVRSIIFFSGTVTAWLVLTSRKNHILVLMLLLLLPSVIKNQLIHVRQGLAIAFFLTGWFSSNSIIRWTWLLLTPFVHSSFFFILIILWASRLMIGIRLGPNVRMIIFLCLGIITGLTLGWLTIILQARQAEEYDFSIANVSGLGFAFWLGITALMFFQGRQYLREHAFEAGIVLFYLSTYWLIEVTARIFESGLLLVLLAGLSLSRWRRVVFVAAILAYGVLMWTARIDESAMGFGIR